MTATIWAALCITYGIALGVRGRSACGCGAGIAALLMHFERFFTFLSEEGVEPTNNDGERAERQGVLWRKISGGTASVARS